MIYAVAGEISLITNMSGAMTNDPKEMMEKDREALLRLRQNLSVEAEDDSVGSGLLVVHDDRHAEIQNQKEEKEKREREKHTRTMYAMQEYISDLQDQVAYHNQRIADLNKDRASFATALAQLENGDLPEMTPDEKMKDERLEARLAEWEKRNGKVDRTDSAALITAIQAMDAETIELIQDHEQKRDNKQEKIESYNRMAENGNIDGVREALENEHRNNLNEATISKNEQVSQMAMEETTERTADTSQNVAVSSKGAGFLDDFVSSDGQDSFESARKLEVTKNFTIVASGEAEMPTQERTQDIAVPSMQININPMGS